MPRLSVLFSALVLVACSPSKPPDNPESADTTAVASAEPTEGTADTAPMGTVVKSPEVSQDASLASYELTPSDCDALGRQYGQVARSDQMAALSPRLTEKQRAATAAQVDKVVGKLEEGWIGTCQSTLVNKSVDHASIKCALAAKTVKAFDVCLNGEHGTPQPRPASPKKKK